MFREFRKIQLHSSQKELCVAPVQQRVTPAPSDPYTEAVAVVRSSGLDPDEEAATMRRLRNFWLMKRLEKLGFEIFG